MHKSLEKWIGCQFSTGSTTESDYEQFQRAMRTDLKRQAKEYGLELHSFHRNHYVFSAVLRIPEKNRFIYVGISDVRFWPDEWVRRVLYRTMSHEKDWTGGANQNCRWDAVGQMAAALAGM